MVWYRGRSNYSPPSSDHQPRTHQIHQRDARVKENKGCPNIMQLLTIQMIKSNFIWANSAASHWKQLVHSCFQRREVARHVSSANCGSFNTTPALQRALCHESTHLGAVAVISRNSGAMSVFAFDPPPWLLMNVTAWRPRRTFGHFVVVVTIRRTTCVADKCPTLIRRTSLGKSRIPTESDIWIVFSTGFEYSADSALERVKWPKNLSVKESSALVQQWIHS